MRPLVTAVDIAEVVKRNEKALNVTGETIITPAARDAARDHGITIVVSDPSGSSVGTNGQKNASIPGIDHASLVRLVQNVIASMGIIPGKGTIEKQRDPSGLCIIKAKSIAAGSMPENSELEVISAQECAVMQAGILCVGGKPYTRETRCDFIGFVIEGSVLCSANGRETAAQCGDVLYLPSSTRIALSSASQAKVFFVTCPAISRNTHH